MQVCFTLMNTFQVHVHAAIVENVILHLLYVNFEVCFALNIRWLTFVIYFIM